MVCNRRQQEIYLTPSSMKGYGNGIPCSENPLLGNLVWTPRSRAHHSDDSHERTDIRIKRISQSRNHLPGERSERIDGTTGSCHSINECRSASQTVLECIELIKRALTGS